MACLIQSCIDLYELPCQICRDGHVPTQYWPNAAPMPKSRAKNLFFFLQIFKKKRLKFASAVLLELCYSNRYIIVPYRLASQDR